MKKDNWGSKNWEVWAKVAIKILPYLKEKTTIIEAEGIQKMLKIKGLEVKILDTCCGWGRHCLELAKHGYQNVFGADISETFIAYAKERNLRRKVKEFIQEDIMNLNFTNEFDVVLNLWHSIGLYKDEEQNLNFFKKIYEFLKPLGEFLVDAANGDRDLQRTKHFCEDNHILSNRHWWYLEEKNILGLTQADFDTDKNSATIKYQIFIYERIRHPVLKERRMLGQVDKWKMYFSYRDDYIPGNRYWQYIDAKKSILRLAEVKKINNEKENIEYRIYEIYEVSNPLVTKKVPLKIYTKARLESLLKAAGFKINNVYGDFQMNKYSIDSPRLIIVAQKL